SVISSSEMPDSATRSIRVLSLRRSIFVFAFEAGFEEPGMSVAGGAMTRRTRGPPSEAAAAGQLERVERLLERKPVAGRSEADDYARREVGEPGTMPERLATVDVAEVDLDERNCHRCQCIAHGDAGVRVGGRIQDDESDRGLRRGLDA